MLQEVELQSLSGRGRCRADIMSHLGPLTSATPFPMHASSQRFGKFVSKKLY